MADFNFDFSIPALNKFLASYAAKDKVGKTVHYGARAYAGYLEDIRSKYAKDSDNYKAIEGRRVNARALFVHIMESRRTLRWFASISVLNNLMNVNTSCPWPKRKGLFIAAQLSLMWWHVIDHLRWLQRLKLVPGSVQNSKRVSFAGFAFSSAVTAYYYLEKLIKAPITKGQNDKSEKKAKFTDKLQFSKAVMTMVACLHISELAPSHEVICGLGGMFSALIDIYLTFPRKAKVQ